MSHILLIEDEDVIRKQLARMLERNRYDVTGVATIEQAIEQDCRAFDLILADIRLPGAAGTEIIAHADPVPVIIMTSYASVRSAVDSMKLGAVDYISKPFDHDELLLLIERSLQSVQLSAQNAALQRDLQRYLPTLDGLPPESPVREVIDRLLDSDPDGAIWLHGESGSGRELVARIAHARGQRGDGPLVFADSLAVGGDSLARFQAQLQRAHGGTLVVRDPESLCRQCQPLLAQLLAPAGRATDRGFDGAIVVISSAPPEALGDETLAEWLGDRVYHIASLRERRGDILALANACIDSVSSRLGRAPLPIGSNAQRALLAYDWPGNVSELRNVVERAILLCRGAELQAADFGFARHAPSGHDDGAQTCLNLDEYFRFVVLRYQEQMSETELAATLGISRKALWERRQRMGLNRNRSAD